MRNKIAGNKLNCECLCDTFLVQMYVCSMLFITLSIVELVDFLILLCFFDNLFVEVLLVVGVDNSSSLLALANASNTLRVW